MRNVPQFTIGDRVRIEDPRFPDFWANGAVGSIAEPPTVIRDLSGGWTGHVRSVRTTSGLQSYYWVEFDDERRDADGDGPYREAEIAAAALHLLGGSPA